MSDAWRSVPDGPAVVAERDQFEADVRDRVRDARLLFCASMDVDGELAVRCLFGLNDVPGSSGRVEAAALFLMRARDALDDVLEQLEGML